MRLLHFLFICSLAALFAVDESVASKRSEDVIKSNDKVSLRSLEATRSGVGKDNQHSGERTINLDFKFLNKVFKFLPGTKAFKKASALKKAVAAAEQKRLKETISFALRSEDNLYKYFGELVKMFNGIPSIEQVLPFFRAAGRTGDEITWVRTSFYRYKTILLSRRADNYSGYTGSNGNTGTGYSGSSGGAYGGYTGNAGGYAGGTTGNNGGSTGGHYYSFINGTDQGPSNSTDFSFEDMNSSSSAGNDWDSSFVGFNGSTGEVESGVANVTTFTSTNTYGGLQKSASELVMDRFEGDEQVWHIITAVAVILLVTFTLQLPKILVGAIAENRPTGSLEDAKVTHDLDGEKVPFDDKVYERLLLQGSTTANQACASACYRADHKQYFGSARGYFARILRCRRPANMLQHTIYRPAQQRHGN
ncbi:unnamed protein product [Phytophthora fragariaefolia]|uniref:Unnamed protein product n=1 Tax=Phytophthora fragariaefolia TaxID=1490495 RepID=A0A9W6YEL5_9STRA|nr:unnamed protein product [Phytophthora fragariaefolia]